MFKSLDYKEEYERISENFRKILKGAIKKYKGVTQSKIASIFNKSQNAVNNWLTSNTKYQCLPNAVDFLVLCKVLDLNPSVFLENSEDCIPEEKTGPLQLNKAPEIPVEANLPFIHTSVSKKVFEALTAGYKNNTITALVSPGKNGTTRAIEYFLEMYKIPAFELEYFQSPEKVLHELTKSEKIMKDKKKSGLILCNNAELFNATNFGELLSLFMTKFPVVLIFKERTPILNTPFFKEKVEQCYLRTLSRPDFETIIKGLLWNIPESAFSIIEARSRGTMVELVNNIKKLLKYSGELLSREDVVDILLFGSKAGV